ncbi:hypothetical protein R1sor_000881 [Riccia sorocarpa]|uniref:CCHC-type domain-containing protein n=1 Tax=Riccia sorocarpa TaxID=122646 RepID=A0ABD3GWZ3_9MARC
MAHVNLKPPSFEGQNFLGWKKLMTLHAMGEDWLDQMEGNDKCPTIFDPNDQAQNKEDPPVWNKPTLCARRVERVRRVEVPRRPRRSFTNQCRNCRESGDWAHKCPKKKKDKGRRKFQANMASAGDSGEELTLAEEALNAQE